MTNIIVIGDLILLQFEIARLYELIQTETDKTKEQYADHGVINQHRIRFEELDLSHHKNDMLSVHKTLQSRKYSSMLSLDESRHARIVSIAGVCELIKEEYTGKFWDLYKRVIGWDKDVTVYDWIWELGFIENGIKLLGDGRREFVQTLVLESGVPKNRGHEIIEFFQIYWRYLRNVDVLDVIDNIYDFQAFSHIPRQERQQLLSLIKDASEYTHAFSFAVNRLSKIFEYIESSEDIFRGDIDDWARKIHREIGINPFSILRDKEQLRSLYGRLLGYITPEKLQIVLLAKPPGTMITFPDKIQRRSDSGVKIQLGAYIVEGAVFTCTPNRGIEIDYLASIPENQVVETDEQVVLRSRSEITPVLNGIVRTEKVHSLYNNRIYYGFLFHCIKKPGQHISLRTNDGQVNKSLIGNDGFVCFPYLQYERSSRSSNHILLVKTNSIILNASSYIDRDVSFICNQVTLPLYRGIVNSNAQVICSERTIVIDSLVPNKITFSAIESDTNKSISLINGAAEVSVLLAHVMLFSPTSHHQIFPRVSGKPFSFGGRHFVLYSDSEPSNEPLYLENCDIEETSRSGSYQVTNIRWSDRSLPCHIMASSANGQSFSWVFEKLFQCHLYINKIIQDARKYVVFSSNQSSHLSDFELVLTPLPERSIQERLFCSIIINHSHPMKIPLFEFTNGLEVGDSLVLSGGILEKLLRPFGVNQLLSNCSIEISVCSEDETHASITFFIFPNLKVMVPEQIQDGEQFDIKVYLNHQDSPLIVTMKNKIGKSKAKIRLTYDGEKWKRRTQHFYGQIKIDSMNTFIDIICDPPIVAIRFGNKKNGNIEPIRNIQIGELGLYDLLIISPDSSSPLITINHINHLFLNQIDEFSWCIPLIELVGVTKRINRIRVKTQKIVKYFDIGYHIALHDIEVQKYLLEQTINGNCNFSGPIGSHIELRLTIHTKLGTTIVLDGMFLESTGRQNHLKSFSISIPDSVNIDEIEFCELSATLVDDSSSTQAGYEYGKKWVIHSKSSLEQKDYASIKVIVSELIENSRPFLAKKHLDAIKDIIPESDKEWYIRTNLEVKYMLIFSSLNDIASQTSIVLKKEYLFE